MIDRARRASPVFCASMILTLAFVALRAGVLLGAEVDSRLSEFSEALAAWNNRAPLEDEFFDLLWRCDSPIATERARARTELARRMPEFEPISCERAFLTNGEISASARDAFLEAEEEYYSSVSATLSRELAVTAVDVEPPNSTGRRRLVAKAFVPERARVLYLVPDFSRYAYLDPQTSTRWISSSPYAAPEIQPDSGEQTIEFETNLEQAASASAESFLDAPAFEALVGCDLRAIVIPALGAQDKAKRDEYRVGELSYDAPRVMERDANRATIEFAFRYETPYDAFDSHRVWISHDDFAVAIKTSDRNSTIISHITLRETARTASGARLKIAVELPQAFDAESLDTLEWTLLWRAPRRLRLLREQRQADQAR